MTHIQYHTQTMQPFIEEVELDQLAPYAKLALQQLLTKEGAGNDFTDWVDWPIQYNKEEFNRIKQAAQKIQSDSEVLIVIGIGGSYLGAKAAIDFLNHSYYNLLAKSKSLPQVFFVGNHLSSTQIQDLIEVMGDRSFSINVISKSGTTTEPAIAFRIFKQKLIAKYGKDEARNRIYVTTDSKKGALKKEAQEEGYETFTIPDGIGGRFTVLTPVGLLPIAVTGADIDRLMQGAQQATNKYRMDNYHENSAMRYAMIRNCLYRKGKDIEILVNNEPALQPFGEWWKQLYAESEGKNHRGLFPVTANFTTDLHSIGQMIQEGKRNLFETVLRFSNVRKDISVPQIEEDLDGLKYLQGRQVSEINEKALEGTVIAHRDGQTPISILEIDNMNEEALGELIIFFEMAVAISGYLNGINPFDQPGVEAYKKNMFALLGKPGYEDLQAQLRQKQHETK